MSKLTILIIITIIAAIGILWYYYFYAPILDLPNLDEEQVQNEYTARLEAFRRLKILELDTGILKDEFFRSLQSPPAHPPEVKPGRPNPFLPF